MSCRDRIVAALEQAAAPYTFHQHPKAFTAQEVAAREHISGDRFAKVVMVMADDHLAMTVLRANDHIDLGKTAQALHAGGARIAHEGEFAGMFPDCEVGAMPPFGNLYGLPVVIDRRLSEYDEIVSQAGTHSETIELRYQDYQRVVHPRVADVTLHA